MSESNDHENSRAPIVEQEILLSPLQRYERDLAAKHLLSDAQQARAIEHVERLYHELNAPRNPPKRGIWRAIVGSPKPRPCAVTGLYLWGRVGRGKTYIVDTFYDCLTTDAKLRIHFHSFMRRIHSELRELDQQSDPLVRIAANWAAKYRLLCLDEFHVGDITDAMILGNLLRALFDEGVTLVATSNEAPNQLYRDGLQRARFLPAIALLEQHLDVFELAGDQDYRLRALEQAGIYYCPHNDQVTESLTERFIAIAPEPGEIGGFIDIEGRRIPTLRHADGVVWFEFETLCGGPRATGDYIEIALCHHTIVLSEVPIMDKDASDAARRFINLIDELYDRNVNLVISAAASAARLYTGTRLVEPFKRTVSRLTEMQSHDYLARPHLCD